MKLKPHQQRVIEERNQLDAKRYALADFTFTKTFSELPRAEQDRMNRQHEIMRQYSNVLEERILAFTKP